MRRARPPVLTAAPGLVGINGVGTDVAAGWRVANSTSRLRRHPVCVTATAR